MRQLIQITEQTRKLKTFFLGLYALPLLALFATAVVSRGEEESLAWFMRDPANLVGLNPFAGVISSVGVIFWSAAAAVSVFGWLVLRRAGMQVKYAAFFLCSAAFTTLLMTDDFFELHEVIFPGYLFVPGKLLYVLYIVGAISLVVAFNDVISQTEYVVLLAALFLLAMSVMVDYYQPTFDRLLGGWRILLEDGLKFLGIVTWLGYFYRSVYNAVSKEALHR